MADDVILVEVADRVAVVTLNRPEARNALNPALTAALAGGDRVVRRARRRRRHRAHRRRPRVLRRRRPQGAHHRLRGPPHRQRATHELIRPVPGDGEAGHRRRQRRRGHRRLRGRAHLRLPGRVRAGALRRHPRAGRDHAGLGAHRAARRSRRAPAGAGDERHRQLRRRADRAGVGAGQPRRPARGAAAVLPCSSAATSCRTTSPACATCSRRTARRSAPPTSRPAASSSGGRASGSRRHRASPTKWRVGVTRSWSAVAPSRAESWPSPRSGSRCPTPRSTNCAPPSAARAGPTRWRTRAGTTAPSSGSSRSWWPTGPTGFDWRAREQVLNSRAAVPRGGRRARVRGLRAALRAPAGGGTGATPARAHPRLAEHALRVPRRRRPPREPRRVRRRSRRRLPRRRAVAAGLRVLGHPASTRHDAARDGDDVRRADARARLRPLRGRRVRLGRVRDRAARPRSPRRARRHPHGDAQLPRRGSLRAHRRRRRLRHPGEGVAARGVGLQRDPGHEAAVARVRAHGLARRAHGVDRREVAALVRLRRRRPAAVHARRAAHHRRHLLVHRHHQQRQPPLLREPPRPGPPERG